MKKNIKIHKARNKTQINLSVAIMKNINDCIDASANDLGIDEELYKALIDNLVDVKQIKLRRNKQKYILTNYLIVDLETFNKKHNNIYEYIGKALVGAATIVSMFIK